MQSHVLFLLTVTAVAASEAPSVETKLGKIVGVEKTVDVFGQQMTVDRFHGIPYAEAPVGKLRFQRPVPKKALTSDETPFQATKHGNICYQLNQFPFEGLIRSEDCLFLNIYAPSSRKDPLPVMVWIHGGGFSTGASDQYVSDTLALYGDVIVVTVNYRLTVWGFLSSGDEHAPGNLGLWDQHTAIKWVHENIDAFGGDPNMITIFGESAGGMSVTYQSLYHGNEGLFQRVIAQSGSMWVTAINEPKSDAQRLGNLVGCEQTESDALIQCLQALPAELLDETLNNFTNGLMINPTPFLPSIDETMFNHHPRDLLSFENAGRSIFSGLDFMSGVCAEEGIVMLGPFTGVADPENFAPNRTSFKDFIPDAWSFVLNTVEPIPEAVKEVVAHEYIDWSEQNNMEKLRSKAVQILSDMMLTAPMLLTLSHHSKLKKESKSTYMYKFDVILPSTLLPTPSWFKNATHGDELKYVFFEETSEIFKSLPGHEDTQIEDWERDVAKYVMNLWTNFAKTGNPNEPRPIKKKWPAYNNEEKQYFRILRDQTAEPIGSNLLPREENLWNKIVPTLLAAIEKSKIKTSQDESGYCDKDGGCEP